MVAKGKVSVANGTDHRDKGRLRLTIPCSVASRAGIRFATFDAASTREDKRAVIRALTNLCVASSF